MRLRETLVAAGTTAALVAGGGGCSTELSKQDIGCAKFVEPGEMTLQSFAKTIYNCHAAIPEGENIKSNKKSPYRGLTIDLPTRDGGLVHLVAESDAPKDNVEDFARVSDFAHISIWGAPVGEKHTIPMIASIGLGLRRDDGSMSVQWELKSPEQQRLDVGLKSKKTVEAGDEDIPNPADPTLIHCVEAAVMDRVVQVLETANTGNDIPKLARIPLTNCNNL